MIRFSVSVQVQGWQRTDVVNAARPRNESATRCDANSTLAALAASSGRSKPASRNVFVTVASSGQFHTGQLLLESASRRLPDRAMAPASLPSRPADLHAHFAMILMRSIVIAGSKSEQIILVSCWNGSFTFVSSYWPCA